MSGIFGLFRFDGKPVGSEHLHRMAIALADYGPDGRRCWMAGTPGEAVGLGHVLMRLTPEDAFEEQPVLGRDGHLALVADARIDNREELAQTLDIPPTQARTLPDSALIMKAYERWGEDCTRHLLGDFVFCVWDRSARRLFCARDHQGSRVLFYHRANGFLAIASAPKGLLALPEVPRRLDEAKIADFLLLTGDPETTFYDGIRRLLPAHTLSATASSMELRPYWSPVPRARLRLRSDDEYVEAFRDVFEAAVRCRLRSAHPLGSFLSGGLDSSAVACVAARLLSSSGQRLTGFVLVPRKGFAAPERRGWYSDETPYVEAIRALHANLEVAYVGAEGRLLLDGLDRLFRTAGVPFRNINRVWSEAALEQAHAGGARVMLGALEGNWTISYSGGALLPELARHGRWLTLMREVSALATAKGVSRRTAFVEAGLKPLLPESWWWRQQLRAQPPLWVRRSVINPVFAVETKVAERMRRFDVGPVFRWNSEAGSRRERWLGSGARQELLDVQAAQRAAFGVDLREVTMDKRIVEFCLAIPSDQYSRNGHERRLIRRAMAGIVPHDVLWKAKRGAEAPDWYERLSPMRDELMRELEQWEESPTIRRCLDLRRMRGMLDVWPQRPTDWLRPEIVAEYRFLLVRGFIAGRFIHWFEREHP